MAVLGWSRSGAPPDQILDPPLNVYVSSTPISLVMISPFAWFLSYLRS